MWQKFQHHFEFWSFSCSLCAVMSGQKSGTDKEHEKKKIQLCLKGHLMDFSCSLEIGGDIPCRHCLVYHTMLPFTDVHLDNLFKLSCNASLSKL